MKEIKSTDSAYSPISLVGKFLDILFNDHDLPLRFSPVEAQSLTDNKLLTRAFVQPLYSCPTYLHGDIVCLILNIFSGIPESHQVMRCQATTKEDELSLFLKRITQHPAHYLMLDINKLPFKLQEVS